MPLPILGGPLCDILPENVLQLFHDNDVKVAYLVEILADATILKEGKIPSNATKIIHLVKPWILNTLIDWTDNHLRITYLP